MAKPKQVLKPNKLYQEIVRQLKIQNIHPNFFNIQLVGAELSSRYVKTPYLVDDISQEAIGDVISRAEKAQWYSEFQFIVARSNKQNMDQVTKYLKQEMKEAPEEI